MLVALPALLAPSARGVHAGQALVASTVHEAGVIRPGERLAHVFLVRNAGSVPLALELVALTQPGLTARFPPTIASGEEGRVRLEWDTSRARGPVEGVAVVRLSDPEQPEVRFTLKAVVQPPIEFQPFGAIFLSAFRGERVQGSVQVVNHEDHPLTILGLAASSERFSASVDAVEAGKRYEVRATTKLDAPLGRSQEPLYLITDHPTRSRLRVLVNVFIKADVYVNPETVDFGQVALAEISGRPGLLNLLAQTFLVKTRQDEIALTAVDSDLDFLELRRSPPAGKSATFRIDVGLKPAYLRPGPISGSIRIATSDPRFRELTVPVRGEIR